MLALIKLNSADSRRFSIRDKDYSETKVYEFNFYYNSNGRDYWRCVNGPLNNLYFCEDELVVVDKEYLKDYGVF